MYPLSPSASCIMVMDATFHLLISVLLVIKRPAVCADRQTGKHNRMQHARTYNMRRTFFCLDPHTERQTDMRIIYIYI